MNELQMTKRLADSETIARHIAEGRRARAAFARALFAGLFAKLFAGPSSSRAAARPANAKPAASGV